MQDSSLGETSSLSLCLSLSVFLTVIIKLKDISRSPLVRQVLCCLEVRARPMQDSSLGETSPWIDERLAVSSAE